jgi:hypothetical protein
MWEDKLLWSCDDDGDGSNDDDVDVSNKLFRVKRSTIQFRILYILLAYLEP